ncbi:Uncharacterised protein [Klebsiella pneumoniae]|nr:Uncharacterised protein [Klebsiella pneumoniae]SXX10933.1 Uncharacterised protein [Klebsiella pneumoniae]SYF43575.1 Uncharacterised protein [Klebsiella pneumoniae]
MCNGNFRFCNYPLDEMCRNRAVSSFHLFIYLHLTRLITFQTQCLALLHIKGIVCQQFEDFRGEMSQFQHALNVATSIPQLVTNLRRAFPLFGEFAESGNLFCRMHGHTLVVFHH